MKKLILLFFILEACSLLNARSRHSNKGELERFLKNIEPQEQWLKEIEPRKAFKNLFRESGFKNSEDEDRQDDKNEMISDDIDDAKNLNVVDERNNDDAMDRKDFNKDAKFDTDSDGNKDSKDDDDDDYDDDDNDYDNDDDDDDHDKIVKFDYTTRKQITAARTTTRNGNLAFTTRRPITAAKTTPWNGNCGVPFVKPNLGQSKIIGGTVAVPHSWPWQIDLRYRVGNSNYHICGGTILTPSTILTAAHCFYDPYTKIHRNNSNFEIVAGQHNIDKQNESPTQNRRIKDLKEHCEYDPKGLNNDIALIILSEPLDFNHNISAACLPITSLADNTQCYSTGWGYTNVIAEQVSDVLLQVLLPLIKSTDCENIFDSATFKYDKKTMICAGNSDPAKNTCRGDSGGPYVCQNNNNNQWTVHGVESFGFQDCTSYSVKTRVYGFLRWIEKNKY